MSTNNSISASTSSRTTFARRLRELRVPRGYRTARSLAQALGIDENRYTRYERAEVEPDLGLLVKICEILALTPNDLLLDQAAAAGMPSTAVRDGRNEARSDEDRRGDRRPPPAPAPLAVPALLSGVPQPAGGAPFATGFAEPSAPGYASPLPSPVAAATLKRRAVAWQIARFVGTHGVDSIDEVAPTSGSDFIGMQTSRVFAAIERDPFGFVTAIAANDRVAALPEAEQKRITGLIDDLIAAVEMIAETGATPPA